MPSAGAEAFGMKMVSVDRRAMPAAPLPVTQGLMILMDGRTRHAAQALLDGAALTGQRTAAVAALGSRSGISPRPASRASA